MDKAENERELVTGTSSESDSDDTESEDNVTDSESSNTSEKEPVSEIFKQAHQTSDNEEAQEKPAHVTNLLRKVAAYKTELHQFSRFGSSAKQLEFLSTQPLQYKKCILQLCLQVFRLKVKIKKEDNKIFAKHEQLLTNQLADVNVGKLKSVGVDEKLCEISKAEDGLLLKVFVSYRHQL